MKPSADPDTLLEQVRSGSRRAAARLMRWVDDQHPQAERLLGQLYRNSAPSELLGITGMPGAGKSTVVDGLIRAFRADGQRVGVVAVDPSSPFTGGAILGDRVRMQSHIDDDDVFIRSLATRGQLGGLSRSTAATASVMEAMGFDRVIIETVGTGQSEVDIAKVADTTVVVVAPGLGDDVQALKAGLMEIADLYVVNKADRPGVDRAVRDIRGAMQLRGPDTHGWMPPVLTTTALSGEGIEAVGTAISEHREHLEQRGLLDARRRARARLELEMVLLSKLRLHMLDLVGGAVALDAIVDRVVARESDCASEARRLFTDSAS